jgi:hypothetical protein
MAKKTAQFPSKPTGPTTGDEWVNDRTPATKGGFTPASETYETKADDFGSIRRSSPPHQTGVHGSRIQDGRRDQKLLEKESPA